MSWFKVDDRLPTHRKVLALKRGTRRFAAVGAWTVMGAWSASNGTDGVVPADIVLDDLGVPQSVLDDLIHTHRIFEREDGSYELHDFLDYNPSAAKVAAEKAATAERVRAWRERRSGQGSPPEPPDDEPSDDEVPEVEVTPAVTRYEEPRNGVTNTVGNGVRNTTPGNAAPTRPDPARPVELKPTSTPLARQAQAAAAEPPSAPSEAAPARRKHKLPDDFQITPAMVEWAREKTPSVDGKAETEQWRDYHAHKGDTGFDWTRSWQTWMRNAEKRTSPQRIARVPDRIAYGDRVLQDSMDRARNGGPSPFTLRAIGDSA